MTDQKTKIVFVSYYYWPPHFGGELKGAIERFVYLSKKGYEIVVFTSGVPGYPRKEVLDGIKIFRSPIIGQGRLARRLNRLLWWLWVYWKMIFERGVDDVHVETFVGIFGILPRHFYGWLLLKIAKIKKAKTVCVHSLATSQDDYFKIKEKWERKFFKSIDTIVCVSNALYEAVNKTFPNRAVPIIYGIHVDVFKPLTAEEKLFFRKAHGIKPGDVVFSFLGSFERRKGLDLIVDSILNRASNKNWKLWLVGPYRKEESQHIHEDEVLSLISPLAEIQDRVKLWGRIDDRAFLGKILASSDVFIFPTRREGLGIAPFEAMACGIPVIVSRIPGITDLANIEGLTGLYIEPGNQVQLERAMSTLAPDSDLRISMGKQARKTIVDEFSWEKYISKWETVYRNENKKSTS